MLLFVFGITRVVVICLSELGFIVINLDADYEIFLEGVEYLFDRGLLYLAGDAVVLVLRLNLGDCYYGNNVGGVVGLRF